MYVFVEEKTQHKHKEKKENHPASHSLSFSVYDKHHKMSRLQAMKEIYFSLF